MTTTNNLKNVEWGDFDDAAPSALILALIPLVRAMGGDIAVNSEYGRGGAFTVSLPQELRQYEKLADVGNPEGKSVPVYERREIYAKSIVQTVENLGVCCIIITTESEFYEEMAKGKSAFVFISSFLLQSAKRVIARLGLDVLLSKIEIYLLGRKS